ncbi:MAG: hypothetical protein RLZZ182_151 [Pseudomonadota bacterium]|jgi:hypothetical protein
MKHVETIKEHYYNQQAIEAAHAVFVDLIEGLHERIPDIDDPQNGMHFKQTGIQIDTTSLRESNRFQLSWCGHQVKAHVQAASRSASEGLYHADIFSRIDFWYAPLPGKDEKLILSLEVNANGRTNLQINNGYTSLTGMTLAYLFVEVFNRVLRLNQST